MIKKSLAAALVMLAVYHLLLPHLPHKFYQILGQQRGNYLKSQRYVYDVPSDTNVIVGSSMAETFNDAALGDRYCKLTLAGGSVFTALEIVQRSGKMPPVVLIETNVMGRGADEELLHDLFSPPFYQLRQYSPIFREEGRPANFVGGFAESVVRKSCEWTARFGYGMDTTNPNARVEAVPPALREKLLQIEQKTWDFKPTPETLRKNTDELGRYVDALTRQGTTCVLFEMPMDESLAKLSSPTLWRQAINERFPADQYHWLTFDRSRNYKTRDGVHLVRAEADLLTQVVIDYMNRLPTQQAASDRNRQASQKNK